MDQAPASWDGATARVALRIHNISPCHTCLTEGIGAYLNKKWVEVKRAAQEER